MKMKFKIIRGISAGVTVKKTQLADASHGIRKAGSPRSCSEVPVLQRKITLAGIFWFGPFKWLTMKLTEEMEAVISDFGFARALGEANMGTTQANIGPIRLGRKAAV